VEFFFCFYWCKIRMSKKIKKLIKLKKLKKNNWKNQTVKKNRLNWLKFWKIRPVRFGFGFISLKPKKPNWTKTRKKTEPNQKIQAKLKNRTKPEKTEPKSSQTEKTKPNRFEPVFVIKNQTEPKQVGLNWFRFILVFFKIGLVIFFL
jgi:hypothetical protein